MDPVTHGLIGAAAAQTASEPSRFRAAALTGALAAMSADLDVFIFSSSDPLLNLEMHRQFSHSLLFAPVGALIVAALLWFFLKKHLSFKQTYTFSLAGYVTAGLTDYLTSYGVHLLWPFADQRYSLDLISVFDPLFSIILLLLIGTAVVKRKKLYTYGGILWVVLYAATALFQQQRVEQKAVQLADSRNHSIEHMVIKPTIANNLLWSVRYSSEDSLYSFGLRSIPFMDMKLYKGSSTPLIDPETEYAAIKGTVLYKDILRFSELSDGYLIYHPEYSNVIGDGRYSMLPTTNTPIWGIKADTSRPDNHVDFGTYRDAGPEIRDRFMNMLLGRKETE